MATEQPPPHVDWSTLSWILGAIAAVAIFLQSAGRLLLTLWRGGSTAVRQSDLLEWVVQRVRGTGTGVPKLGERPEGGTILFELAEHGEAISSLGHSDKEQSDRLAVLEAQVRVLLLLRGLEVDRNITRYQAIAEAIEKHDAMKDTGQWLALRDDILKRIDRARPGPQVPPAVPEPPAPRRLPYPSTHRGRDDE